MKNNDIRILFLAKYAPSSIDSPLPSGIEDNLYAEYHYDIYNVLYNNFSEIISTNNIDSYVHNKPEVDYIFSLYNRLPFRNSEIFVSTLAEYYNIAYLGARPNIRSIAEDKHLAKMQAKHVGLNTPNWCTYNVNQNITSIPFDGPYFVKPRYGASSLNIDSTCYCNNLYDVQCKARQFYDKNIDIIVEQYIKGTSITVPILNNFGQTKVLPFVIENSDLNYNVITYKQKRKITSGLTRTVNTDSHLQKHIESISTAFFESIQPLDYTRIDYIIDSNGMPYFIEFNVCCNLGKHAAINLAAQKVGITYSELIQNILYSSLYRQHLIDSFLGQKL